MNKTIFTVLSLILLSACTAKTESTSTTSSTFKNTPECIAQLKDITDGNFQLHDISKDNLKFEVTPNDANEESIQITAQIPKNNEIRPIGKIKVNKTNKTIHNSTFDDMNLIEVKLGKQSNFIENCF